jgi:hypothetical protein
MRSQRRLIVKGVRPYFSAKIWDLNPWCTVLPFDKLRVPMGPLGQ